MVEVAATAGGRVGIEGCSVWSRLSNAGTVKRTAILVFPLSSLLGVASGATSPSVERFEVDGGSLSLSPSVANLLAFKGALVRLRGARGLVDLVQPVDFKAIESTYREVMTEKLNALDLFGEVVSSPFHDSAGKPVLYISPTFHFAPDTVSVRLEVTDEETFTGHFVGSGAGTDSYTVSDEKAYWECRADLEEDFQRFIELIAKAAGIEPPSK